MPRIETNQILSKMICTALELDPSRIVGLRIDLQPRQLAVIEVTRLVNSEELGQFVHELTKYELTEK